MPHAFATADATGFSRMSTARENRRTGLLEVDDILDSFDTLLEYLLVLLLAHLLVLGRDGEEHQDGLDGLLDELEELRLESPDVGEVVAVRRRCVEAQRG